MHKMCLGTIPIDGYRKSADTRLILPNNKMTVKFWYQPSITNFTSTMMDKASRALALGWFQWLHMHCMLYQLSNNTTQKAVQFSQKIRSHNGSNLMPGSIVLSPSLANFKYMCII